MCLGNGWSIGRHRNAESEVTYCLQRNSILVYGFGSEIAGKLVSKGSITDREKVRAHYRVDSFRPIEAIVATYLCVNGEWRIPGIGRNDFADAKAARLGGDLAHILHRILPLFFGWAVSGSFFKAMGLFLRLFVSRLAVGCPRRSTELRSNGALTRELSGAGGTGMVAELLWQTFMPDWAALCLLDPVPLLERFAPEPPAGDARLEPPAADPAAPLVAFFPAFLLPVAADFVPDVAGRSARVAGAAAIVAVVIAAAAATASGRRAGSRMCRYDSHHVCDREINSRGVGAGCNDEMLGVLCCRSSVVVFALRRHPREAAARACI